jgi:hypothetical protein
MNMKKKRKRLTTVNKLIHIEGMYKLEYLL